MSCLDGVIKKIEDFDGEMLTTCDLIYFGVFTSPFQACMARKNKNCPEFVRMSPRRILHPKQAVIEWLRKKERETSWQKE